jgi:hypothetical protein
MKRARTAYSKNKISAEAASEIRQGLAGSAPRALVFFAGVDHDGAVLGRALEEAFPGACVLGCSTNGEFCDRGYGQGGVAALALGEEFIGSCAVAMADVGGDIEAGVQAAAERLGGKLGQSLRALDPERFVGLALLEGAKGREEAINSALGNAAPFLSFVGGSAGDNITFSGTWTWADGQLSRDGTALFVAEMRSRFRTVKACNFVPGKTCVTVTRTDPARRLILELDGEPAALHYARVIGENPDELRFEHFLAHPLGLMIEGEPWLRSVVRREGDALFCACAVVEGARLHFMEATDLVADSAKKLEQAAADLGAPIAGALFFNCACRMLEAQIKKQDAAYHELLSSIPHAGMHSNGESYLGHINQTLTGLIVG